MTPLSHDYFFKVFFLQLSLIPIDSLGSFSIFFSKGESTTQYEINFQAEDFFLFR